LPTQLENENLSQDEFRQISDLAHQSAGIDLTEGKRDLVQARVGRIVRSGNFGSFKEYYKHLVADTTGEELIALLDALTTNFTSFLREPAHFDFLRKTILPGASGPIRIWSAGCSTGEEPFTIAFSLLEELGGMEAASRVTVLATDLSTRVLAVAQQAAYTAERFEGLPPEQLRRYLLRGSGRWEGWYRVKPPVRERIEFRRLNLIEPFHHHGRFHAIFCRNVMMYFSKAAQASLVNRLAQCVEPGGYLLIGHSESLTGIRHPFQYLKPAVYRMPL